MARVPADATAFAHRTSRIMVNVAAFYDGPTDRLVREAWVDDFAAALRQGDAGAYVNFLGDEGEARIRAGIPGRRPGTGSWRSSPATTRPTCSGSTRTSRRPDPDRSIAAPAGRQLRPDPGAATRRGGQASGYPGRVVRWEMWAPGWAPEFPMVIRARWDSAVRPRPTQRGCPDAHGPAGDQQPGFAATPGRVCISRAFIRSGSRSTCLAAAIGVGAHDGQSYAA